METVADAIRDLQARFAARGFGSPRLDAELLVGHALGQCRAQILANLREPIDRPLLDVITKFGERRLRGEPVAYILGRKEFFGQEFQVGPTVLTPRPETELLVEWAIDWLAHRPDGQVIDVGTGSGAIAVSIALHAPVTVSITAIDISAEALAAARRNADRLVPGRIRFEIGDLLSGQTGPVDLILANLPYLRPDQTDGNLDLIAEPRIALDGGHAGLDLIERLISQVPAVLSPSGAIALEIDPSQSRNVVQRIELALPGASVEIHRDLAGLDRFVSAVRI